ncbi:MAG TPA: Wzy polymerase domain-containing protein [Rubrivivax sp.]|nr:Wzy polymerase domain-containing protein [Rubrivivax sp.]
MPAPTTDHTPAHLAASAAPETWLMLAATSAAAAPALLAYNVAPSPTFLNQAMAFGLWGAFIGLCRPHWPNHRPWPVWAALALLMAAALWPWGPGALPASLAWSAVGALAAAVLLVTAGAGARRDANAAPVFAIFCWAWLIAGLLNVAIAVVQVFRPDLADGDWIAVSGIAGRAVGNLRQPNHLSSLLLWACIATVALLQMRRLAWRWAAACMAALVFAVVLTASRTGLLSVGLLALWGLLDRRLDRAARGLLLAAPLLYAVSWFGMAQWAAHFAHEFGGTQRLAESDISGSRFGIWANTLALIRAHPWTGVGFGEFNFAWTLTPFPGRPVAFFDHTHNLPLQLAVELGLPLSTLVMGLLLAGLWLGGRRALQADGDLGTAQRSAMLMVLMIGLHSLLEYPLWYAYFLLPTAWAWGFALQDGSPPPGAELRRPLLPAIGGLLLIVGAMLSVLDYARVAAIFSPSSDDLPLAARVAQGQRSVLFSHHADYAALTSGLAGAGAQQALAGATHYLLDTRLMMAWARTLAAQGDLDGARTIAARLREFGKTDAEDFFSACPVAASAPGLGLPFQCELPQTTPGWQALLPLHR